MEVHLKIEIPILTQQPQVVKTEIAVKTGRYAELPTIHIETELTLNPSQEGDGAAAASRELVPYEPEADIDLTDDPSLCGEYREPEADIDLTDDPSLCGEYREPEADVDPTNDLSPIFGPKLGPCVCGVYAAHIFVNQRRLEEKGHYQLKCG